MARLLDVLGDLGIPVTDQGFDVGPCFIRLKVRPDPKRATVKKILNRAADVQVQMGLPTTPLISPMDGYVGVDIPRTERQPLALEDLLRRGEPSRPSSDAAFPLGMGVDGRVFWADLAEPNATSLLIGGTSGSGKSVLLRSIVVGLLLAAPVDSVRFILIDPKLVTFADVKGIRAIDGGEPIVDVEGAMAALRREVDEMDRRYGIMAERGVASLAELNEARGHEAQLERRVVIIDEYADLMIDKGVAKELETLVQRIAQKGRAAGLHMILATQRPDRKVVTGLIKANLQLHVALKVGSSIDSQIVIDAPGAQDLLGHGDMLVRSAAGLERLQGAFVDPQTLDRVRA